MLSFLQISSHTSELNCHPLFVVTVPGTPYLVTHVSMKASAQAVAVMVWIGTASNHLVDLSTIVSMYVNPSSVTGRGPTVSMWT